MDDEVTLTGEQAVLASRIRTIDRDLDDLEHRTIEMVKLGMRGGSAAGAGVLKMAEDKADEKKARLLAERADLVQQLKESIGHTESGTTAPGAAPSGS